MAHDSHSLSNSTEPSKPLTVMNAHSVQKLTSSNYIIWKAQLEALLIGYDLHQFIDGSSNPRPTKVTTDDGRSTLNPAHITWVRQDKLLFGALVGTLSPSLGPLISRATTSKEAWDILAHTYAKPSRGHIQQLKSQIKNLTKGSTDIETYMTKYRRIIDELALLGAPLDPEDITDHILDGLDDDYKPLIDAVQARDIPISF